MVAESTNCTPPTSSRSQNHQYRSSNALCLNIKISILPPSCVQQSNIDAFRCHREPYSFYRELYFGVTTRRVQDLLERLDVDGIIQLILVPIQPHASSVSMISTTRVGRLQNRSVMSDPSERPVLREA